MQPVSRPLEQALFGFKTIRERPRKSFIRVQQFYVQKVDKSKCAKIVLKSVKKISEKCATTGSTIGWHQSKLLPTRSSFAF